MLCATVRCWCSIRTLTLSPVEGRLIGGRQEWGSPRGMPGNKLQFPYSAVPREHHLVRTTSQCISAYVSGRADQVLPISHRNSLTAVTVKPCLISIHKKSSKTHQVESSSTTGPFCHRSCRACARETSAHVRRDTLKPAEKAETISSLAPSGLPPHMSSSPSIFVIHRLMLEYLSSKLFCSFSHAAHIGSFLLQYV